jgi:predicted phage terminase large subunit-like protein
MTSSRASAELERELARRSPAGFAYVASRGKWMPAAHLLLISEKLCAIARGEIDRLMVFMPPRSGKSQLISEYTPPWYLGCFPDRRIILASYGAALASTWGRRARNLLTEFGPGIFEVEVDNESKAADRWDIAGRTGGMITAGVGGPISGRGAHCLIIDDPVKNAEEAASEVIRAKHMDWWRSVARTRLMPGGAVVLLQTRWHEADLAGSLLAEMQDGGDQWEVLSLPAIAEDDGDVLGRSPGAALWPAFFDEEALQRTKRSIGSYFWSALYQQRPAPAEGFLFKRKDFRYWHEETNPAGAILQRWYVLTDDDGTRRFDTGTCPRFQTADVAISEKEAADWTVVATWAVTPAGDLLLVDLDRRHFEEQQTVQFLADANDKHGRVPMWIERFGAGRNPLAILARRGHPVQEVPAEAGAQMDKITRAFGAVALCEQHKLFLPRPEPEWLGPYVSELGSFPNAAHDDQVDVTAYAARLLPTIGMVGRRQVQPIPAPKPHSAGILNQRF